MTEVGAEYYQKFRQFLIELDEMESTSEPSTLQGSIKLHLPPALARVLVVPALPVFYAMHPNVTLRITLRNDTIDLIEEGVDMSVRFGTVDGANIISRPVGSMALIAVCSPGYVKSFGKPEQPEDLMHHNCLPFLERQTGRCRKWVFSRNGEALELPVMGNLVLNNADAQIDAAILGIGVAQVPSYVARDGLRSGALVEVLREFKAPGRDLNAIYPVDQRSSPRIRVFVELLRETLAHYSEAQVKC